MHLGVTPNATVEGVNWAVRTHGLINIGPNSWLARCGDERLAFLRIPQGKG